MAPKYLFRVYSIESNGTNTPHLFSPASATNDHDVLWWTGEELRTALLGRHAPSNPFIFFTSSLLFALQLAAYKRSNGENGIYLTCIDTTTASDLDSGRVEFSAAKSLMESSGVELRNRSDDSIREYEGVFVVTRQSVKLGAGSSYIGYQQLIDKGLFHLYPELEAVTQRRNVRLHLTVTDLRKYWFTNNAHPLTEEKAAVAARIAAAFSSMLREGGDIAIIPRHLLLWFLALRKREPDDPVLLAWVDRRSCRAYSTNVVEQEEDGLAEVDQYNALDRQFRGKDFHPGLLQSNSSIAVATLRDEANAWNAWHSQSRAQHRVHREVKGDSRTRSCRPKAWRVDKPRQRRECRPHVDSGRRRLDRPRNPVRERRFHAPKTIQ